MKKIKHLNLVIVPRIGRSFFNVVISHKLLYAAGLLIFLIVSANVYLLVGYVRIKRSVNETAGIKESGVNVNDLRKETEELRIELENIKAASKRIERKTGISPEPGAGDYKRREVAMPSRGANLEVENIQRQLRQLKVEVTARKDTMTQAENKVNSLVSKYNRIPSMKPVRGGKINSGFGYRPHPVYGGSEFHRGLDIKGAVGAPIYSTADGTVKYSGWWYGYGRTVIVDHGNGFETLYGHNYRNLVQEGEQVKKGQIVAYVGSSGMTTGAHVHFEVHYRDRLMNPQKFISLSLQEAARYYDALAE